MSYIDDMCRPVASLENGLNINELLKNGGTEFQLTADNEEEENTSPEFNFNFEEAQRKLVNLDLIDVDETEDGVDGTPFDKYRRKMTDVIENGKLKKFIVRQGAGDLVPDNCVVYVSYQAYCEYQEDPFDCSLMQNENQLNSTIRLNLAKRNVIYGLHEAILTMRKGEKAEFLVHHDLAYGRLGCPPRIPPEATVLFVVEVERFVNCGEAFEEEDEDDIPPDERNKFSRVNTKAKALNLLANDCYKNGNFSQAVQKYRVIINMLHNANVADEAEEKQRNKFLMKIYSNACICYEKLKQHKKVCIMVNDAIKVNSKEAMRSEKLMYYWGKAKMHLGDYDSARKHLLAAQKLSPKDKIIGDTFMELMKKEQIAKAQEKIMWQKACNFQPSSVKIRELTKEEEALREMISEQLAEFKSGPTSEWTLRRQFTHEEETAVVQVAKELGLYARVADGEKRVIIIKKPNDC